MSDIPRMPDGYHRLRVLQSEGDTMGVMSTSGFRNVVKALDNQSLARLTALGFTEKQIKHIYGRSKPCQE